MNWHQFKDGGEQVNIKDRVSNDTQRGTDTYPTPRHILLQSRNSIIWELTFISPSCINILLMSPQKSKRQGKECE